MSAASHTFSISSINVNGLNNVRKRRLVFNFLRKKKNSIFLLQETHCRPGNGRLWKSQWASTMFLSEQSGSVGGVAILFSSDLNPLITNVTPSAHSRFLIASFSLFEEKYKLVSVYMPTADKEREQISVLEELNATLEGDDGAHLIIGGDFNVALNEELDRTGYAHPSIPNKSFRAHLSSFLEKHDLVDTWRCQHPASKGFTWSRAGQLARLDYIFFPDSFPGHVKAYTPASCSFSDHRLISLTVHPSSFPKGRGFWRLRVSLLNRDDYCREVLETIIKAEEDSEDLLPITRWEYVKLKIRELSIKFSKKIKEESSRLEAELETQLLSLGNKLENSHNLYEEYQGVKRELFQIQLIQARESMIRSRCRWVGEGERPTKYFLNLEKKNFASKVMSGIRTPDGTLLSDPEEILSFEKEYFSNQYAKSRDNAERQDRGEDELFIQPSDRVVSDLDNELLNRELTMDELELALKDMKNGKTPGSDGLPPEFFKRFWGVLGPLLLSCFRQAFELGTLSPDQRRGIIALIPKKGRDKTCIKNWRPISMLNSDYKILAKALAKRLSSVLPVLIHPNQTGFIPTRQIGDNIRNIQALMDFTQETGRSGLMISLDFSAAFDSLDHSFLFKAFESFRLGETFLTWIRVLSSSAVSCVLNSGVSSGWFPFQRGIRQGCPISPFLFALAAEKMADAIRRDPEINGIDLLDTHTKLLQFADDTSLFLRDESSLLNSLQLLEKFRRVSGLGLNIKKSQGIIIGDINLTSEISQSIPWEDHFKVLGIHFDKRDYEGKDARINFDPAIKKMSRVCSSWAYRNLSLKGKTVVLNTLVLPIVYFQCVMLPVPPQSLKAIENVISSFLWNNKRPKIGRPSLEQPTSEGGLGLHNISNRIKAAKITWLKKLALPPTEPWQFYFEFKMDYGELRGLNKH